MKILLATDGSDYSQAAIGFCRNIIADPENTSVKIISAVDSPPAPIAAEPFVVSAEYYAEIERTWRRQADEYVRQAEEQLLSMFFRKSLDVTTEVVAGKPPRAIVERAKEWDADLIVVGSHGSGFWSRALLGSVSGAVVRHAACSVLVVRKPENLNG